MCDRSLSRQASFNAMSPERSKLRSRYVSGDFFKDYEAAPGDAR
jgi:hypothetical protein